jgi:DNA-binding response OmpR family regulator
MPNRRPVLTVDNDAERCETLAERLSAASFGPVTAETAATAAATIAAVDVHFCAMILDVGLPDRDGRDLRSRLRQGGVVVPIFKLTGADTEQDVVRGLDAGANDYTRKPFRAAEHHTDAAARQVSRIEPSREHLAVHPRQLALQPHLPRRARHRRSLLPCLEQARRTPLAHYVHRSA